MRNSNKNIYIRNLGIFLVISLLSVMKAEGQGRFLNVAKSNPDWVVGLTYRPFNLNLKSDYLYNNHGELQQHFRRVKANDFLSSYYGLYVQKRISDQIYMSSGIGYSSQVYKFEATIPPGGILFEIFNKIRLNYVQLPLGLAIKQPLDGKGTVGVQAMTGLLLSYSTAYFIENEFWKYTDSFNENPQNLEFRGANVINNGRRIGYWAGESQSSNEYIYAYPEFVRRFLIGGLAETEFYLIIARRIHLSSGIWYNYDFLTPGSKKHPGFDFWDHDGKVNFYSTRWGFSFKLGYIIE